MQVLDMSGLSNHKFHQLSDLLRLQDQVDGGLLLMQRLQIIIILW